MRAGGEGKAEERGIFRREYGAVVKVLVVVQHDRVFQPVDGDALLRQGISPEMARRYHSQYEGVEGIGIVCVGGEVGRGVFGIVGGGYFSPGAAPVMSQLADAVAPGLYGVQQDGADVYRAGVCVYIIEGAFHEALSKLRVLVLAGAEDSEDCE